MTFAGGKKCKVKKGRWTCPYTGKVFTNPKQLDVDHMVALGNAARSGGQAWGRDRKRDYANDLDHAEGHPQPPAIHGSSIATGRICRSSLSPLDPYAYSFGSIAAAASWRNRNARTSVALQSGK